MKNNQIDFEEVTKLNQMFSGFSQEFLSQKPCRIHPNEVIEKINNNEKILIVDIRTKYEQSFVGYTLENSLHIPMDELFKKESMEKLAKYSDYEIVLSCHKGFRTLVATAFLQRIGIMNVKSLEGGIAEFALSIKP
jgi:rhodanese-related sulfurtransferase